ncbi:hypothetical protein BGX27_000918 [Mortierella sp. AM989]|nr:hypothetical protein BGX27_000918 [Mortierella sp. AM989]
MQIPRIPLRSIKAFLYAICIITTILLIFTDPVSAQDGALSDILQATDSSSNTSGPVTTTDSNIPTSPAPAPSMDPGQNLPPLLPPSPVTTTNANVTTTTHKPDIALPTVMYIPPVISMNASDPFFPKGSESCQKCKFFYPKLKECNQVANTTLGSLPRITGDDTTIPETTTTLGYAPTEFTTILPFLKCICPNQGLPAVKVCMTCFRGSNQRNFLDRIEAQNVSTALSSFQEACMDSDDGNHVPPPVNRGQSASTAGIRGNGRYRAHVVMGVSLLMTGVMVFLGDL